MFSVAGYIVRPITPGDATSWAEYACLPEVKEHTSSTVATVEDVADEIQRTLSGHVDAPIRFVLTPHDSEAVIATVGFHSISTAMRTAEVAYDVAPTRWGAGIATAACRAATIWAFEARGWQRIQGTTVVPNIGSQRVLEKCGFKREGVARNFRPVRGVPTDYIVYSIIPGELSRAQAVSPTGSAGSWQNQPVRAPHHKER